MAYFNEINQLIKIGKKEYFEIIIRDTFFVVEGYFEIKEANLNFVYLKGKKNILLFHGINIKIASIKRCEIIFSGKLVKWENKDAC